MRAILALVLFGCTSPASVVHDQFVASRIASADHEQLVRVLATDLDDNGTVDNELGSFLETFGSQARVDESTAAAIGGDQILLLLDFASDGRDATLTTAAGASPTPEPCTSLLGPCTSPLRHFAVASSDEPMTGTATDATFDGARGTITLPVATTAGVVRLPLVGARSHVVGISEDGIVSAIVGGALRAQDVTPIVLPAIAGVVRGAVATDCTPSGDACGCAKDSAGDVDLGIFDTDHDCAISDDEIAQSQLLKSVLAPDVTIDGEPAVSFGVEIQAVQAVF